MPREFVSYIWITPKNKRQKIKKRYSKMFLEHVVVQLEFNIYCLKKIQEKLFQNTQI